ncbi:MAG TPA: DeoR/GlpR transcriptional regulator [Bacteroidetes bacterium]|nr:DeoR/GlpR transcriptional regulator [Bacteroidota bacterium]
MDKRHKQILEILKEKRQVKVKDLSESLNTSEVTIRKDLKLLETNRLLFRNHGGASLDNPYVNDRSVNEKEFIHASEKSAIGREAAKIIAKDQFIMIASGTTVLAFAKYINPLKKLTVVTSALNVAIELLKKPTVEVLQLGGYIRPSSCSVIGHYSEMILKETACSKLFLSVDGIDLDYGLSTTNTLEAHLNLKMIDSATEVVVLADSSKFGKKSFGRICGIEQVDHIFTDKNIAPEYLKKMKSLGVKVTVCG